MNGQTSTFCKKRINKEIMKRSRLRNKVLNTKSEIDRKACNKQRNLCAILMRQLKKYFRKTVKPVFTDKITNRSKVTLIEKRKISTKGETPAVTEEVISDDFDIADTFNKFFVNIVLTL